MKDFTYVGEFTLSMRTPEGQRFLTVMGDGRVRLPVGSSPSSVFRLYAAGQTQCFLTTMPRTLNGREDAYGLSLSFGDGGGAGSLGGDPTVLELESRILFRLGDSETRIVLRDRYLDCKSGRESPPDLFHFLSRDPRQHGLFPPRAWILTGVRIQPFNGADMRYADFSGTMGSGSFANCDFRNARLNGSMVILHVNGSKLEGANADGTTFGLPGQAALSSKLEGTTWKSASLVGASFASCAMTKADFRGVVSLKSAKFEKADLREAKFTGCDLTGVSFAGADLRGADLGGCNLTGANFTGADLRGVNLAGRTMTNAILTDAWLAGADLSGTDLTTAKYVGKRPRFRLAEPKSSDARTVLKATRLKFDLLGLDWTSLDLTGAEMSEVPATLNGLQAKFSLLTGRDLTGRDLTGAVFTGSTLTNVKFNNAILVGANLADQDLTTVDFTGAKLGGAHLERSDLSRRDLSSVTANPPPVISTDPSRRTKLRGTTFKAGLFGKTWTALDMTDAKIQDVKAADLTGMQADDALLVNVSLLGANFNPAKDPTDATKEGAVSSFRRTRFHNANLQKTQFKKARLDGAQFGALLRVFEFDAPAEPADLLQAVRQHGFQTPPGARLRTAAPDLLHEGEHAETYLVRRERRSGDRFTVTVNESASPADLSEAYLAGATLTNANLEGVTANEVHIYGGDDSGQSMLDGAMMSGITLVRANLGTTNLSKAKLNGANLNGANLIGATLSGADLSPAVIGGREVRTDLTATYLAGATFTDAKLDGAVLSNAAVPSDDGVYLFTLDPTLATELAGTASQPGAVPEAIQLAFKGKNVTLAAAATAKTVTPSKKWLVDNESGSPSNLTPGYVVFTLVAETTGLIVFGATLRVARLGADNRQEVRTMALTRPTGLSDRIMTGETYCPNRQKLKDLKTAATAWDERWLRAPDPPKPPLCVPSMDHYCPPEE